MRAKKSRQWLEAHAGRLLHALNDEQRIALADSPIDTVAHEFGIQVEMQVDLKPTAECGIDGIYYHRPQPRICYAPSPSPGRRGFTVLHEFGHHLQADDEVLVDEQMLMPARESQAVEEDLCDTIAAELLLPRERVDAVIPDEGPTADSVRELFARSEASREACCVRAAQRLHGPGYIVLADPDGIVRFAAPAGTPYRIRRDTGQGHGHLLARAGKAGTASGQAWLTHATGTRTPLMHAQAIGDGEYVYGVFTRGPPPWGGLNVLPEEAPRAEYVTCPHCDHEFPAYGRPCRSCGDYECRQCGKCGCNWTPAAERLCSRCFLRKPPAEFPEAGANVCLDCS